MVFDRRRPHGRVKYVRVMGHWAGGEISPDMEQVPPDGLNEIELPMQIGPDAIAFEVVGMSVSPRYAHYLFIFHTRS